MESKLYLLLGETYEYKRDVIRSWTRLPHQSEIDALVAKHNGTYVRFVVMEDILFIEGDGPKSDDWAFPI